MNQYFTDVCPLLDRPTGGQNYLQPVQANKNIELVTRNLPAAVLLGHKYMLLNTTYFSIDHWFQLYVLCEWNKPTSYVQQ